jgi:hypothetical protein
MAIYKDEEKLILKEKVYITKDCKKLLKIELKKLKLVGRKISMAKLVCNLIIKSYELSKD